MPDKDKFVSDNILYENRIFVKLFMTSFMSMGINGKKAAIILSMRKFVVLLGILLLVMGFRLYNNGLLNCGYSGKLSYGTFDTKEIESSPFLIDGPHRLDIEGDENTALSVIANLSGRLLWSEKCGEIKIYYAYSPRLCKPIKIHDKEINLMIAVSDNKVSMGTPLLFGSY